MSETERACADKGLLGYDCSRNQELLCRVCAFPITPRLFYHAVMSCGNVDRDLVFVAVPRSVKKKRIATSQSCAMPDEGQSLDNLIHQP